MQNPSLSNNHPYLNRLALTTADVSSIDPYSIIKDFYSFGPVAEMKDLFNEACRAALSAKYSWAEGAPGNLLYFYEQLEKLVEASFLLCSNNKQKKKLPDQANDKPQKIKLKKIALPCSLSVEEMHEPLGVLASFFELHSLKKWKQDLYAWLEAGLSNYTVLDTVEAKDIIPYYHQLLKLMDACWCICQQHKKKKRKKK